LHFWSADVVIVVVVVVAAAAAAQNSTQPMEMLFRSQQAVASTS
jgi:hypothetical protein